MKYRVLDLFAGAGGLSAGFMQTGKFIISAAAENDKYAHETFVTNHPDAYMERDITKLNFEALVDTIGGIDIIIGGPPCQGFSNANRQRNRIISDNNQLVKRYVQAVLDMRPLAFVMENVKMLASPTHCFYMTNDEEDILRCKGIKVTGRVLSIDGGNSLHELFCETADGIQPNYDLFNMLALNEKSYFLFNLLRKSAKDENTYSKSLSNHRSKIRAVCDDLCEKYKDITYKPATLIKAASELILRDGTISEKKQILDQCMSAQRGISAVLDLYSHNIATSFSYNLKGDLTASVYAYKVIDYVCGMLSPIYDITKGVLSAAAFGVPQERERYIFLGRKKNLENNGPVKLPQPILVGDTYILTRDAMADLENEETTKDCSKAAVDFAFPCCNQSRYSKYVRDCNTLYNHIITDTSDVAMERFQALRPGQNFHDLDVELKTRTYSDPARTQNTIYRRLSYDTPSGTVVNVRKSMWIHPILNRGISVREAARLQSFQDHYRFCGPKNAQFQQVGNAVPPRLGRAIAESVLESLGDKPDTYLREDLIGSDTNG